MFWSIYILEDIPQLPVGECVEPETNLDVVAKKKVFLFGGRRNLIVSSKPVMSILRGVGQNTIL
jgi:hypothetical protein